MPQLALSVLLCSIKVVFAPGHPWPVEECDHQAALIMQAAAQAEVKPLLITALYIQECDLRDNVVLPIYRTVGRRKVQIGVDACPLGVRLMGPFDRARWTQDRLFKEAARRLTLFQDSCKRHHCRHDFVTHYNPGNPLYAAQVRTLERALAGRPPKDGTLLTPRTQETVRRLLRVTARRS
jgi:hypothetical protein